MAKNWAIAIGINHYDNLQSLKYAQRDAEVMKDWFEREASFDRVFLFTENSPPIPANPPIPTQPTHARFLRFLNVQFQDPLLNPEDNLWFFFAGHGRRYQDQDYLMFVDSDPQGVDKTAISVDYVVQRLRRCGADNVVLLIDACRDEGNRGGLGVGQEEHKGVITFYSCRANQQSFEIDELQHGAFTHTLLEGLRLQGESNCATVERLDKYLRDNVPQINATYGKQKQNPYLKAEPPYKLYSILLEQSATLKDVEPLRYQAALAETKGDLPLAKQLWIRVLAVSRADLDAIEAIGRIAVRQQNQSPLTPKPLPDIATTQTVTTSRGDTADTATNQEKRLTPDIATTQPVTPSRGDTADTAIKPEKRLTFEFDVVTVDRRGQEINRKQGQAEYFQEDLGNNITLDMVYIPGGNFMMGSPEGEGYDSEKPQHGVTVPPFLMGKYQVTQAQWKAVAALPKINRDLKPDPSRFKGDHLPVEQVSWYDAVEFCNRLSKQTGKEYRLPSEAEWEYACRAGTTTPFYFGETITDKLANYRASNTFADEPRGEYREKTTPVGLLPPNTFGLYDMHGNVWEWCLDDWHDNYKGAPNNGSAWSNGNNNNLYQISGKALLRGGSWTNSPDICRSASHVSFTRTRRDDLNIVGFRVVCTVGVAR